MAADFQDYYSVLGVSKTATQPEIKKAFRALARKYHPDVAKDKATAEDRFKNINEAYEVLGNPEKRKKYDNLGAAWNQPDGYPYGQTQGHTAPQGFAPGGAEFQFDGTGFSDFFEQYFSGNTQNRGPTPNPGNYRTTRGMRGQDIEGDLMVTLQEAFTGSTRTIAMRKVDPSTGAQTTDEVEVRIPPGIGEGQRLRVPGHGGNAFGEGENGDLYLRIRIASHPDIRVNGHDLYQELILAPWEATLGITLPINSPSGKTIQVKIPPGSSSGDQLRLKGYGLPKKNNPGDFFIELSIASPTTLSTEERNLWQQLQSSSTFKPREA